MKFPKFHYERITELIKSYGYDPGEFYMVKRKGWIRIEHSSSAKFFTYFKKKQTTINPVTKQWEYEVSFRIKMENEPEIVVKDFDSMIKELDIWLKNKLSE